MSGRKYYKTPKRSATKSTVYTKSLAGVRARAGTGRISAKMVRGPKWSGGFQINRLRPTWTISNINTGARGSFEVVSDTSNTNIVGGSTFNLGTPVQVNGYGTLGQFNVPFSLNFSLDSVAQYTDITNISDRYRINKVKVVFWCAQSQAVGTDAGTTLVPTNLTAMPTVRWDEDRDDNTAPTVQQFKAKMSSKAGNMSNGRRIECWIKPVPAPVLYQPAAGTAYAVPSYPTFINSAYPNVSHYGIKGVFENIQGAIADAAGQVYNTGATVMCETTYYLSVRDLE